MKPRRLSRATTLLLAAMRIYVIVSIGLVVFTFVRALGKH
jgi:hypothetical protein